MIPAHSSGAACGRRTPRAAGTRSLGDDGPLGVAAVGVPAREARVDAQVLAAPPDQGHPPQVCRSQAMPTRSPRDRRAARAEGVDHADHLVPRHGPGTLGREIAFGDVEVRAAHAAGRPPHPHFARGGLGDGSVDELERAARHRAGRADHPRLHHPDRTGPDVLGRSPGAHPVAGPGSTRRPVCASLPPLAHRPGAAAASRLRAAEVDEPGDDEGGHHGGGGEGAQAA